MILVVFCLIAGSSAIQWSPDVRNGSTLHACAGRDVALPWSYRLEQFEEIIDVEWYFTPHYSNSSNCTNRWSEWINRDHPSSNNADVEKMTSHEMTQFCPDGHVTDVQCQSIQGFPVYDHDEGLQCNVKHGFLCSEIIIAPVHCNDYQIRYFCRCSDTDNKEYLLATYRSGVFEQNPQTEQNVTRRSDTDAGLTLHDVTAMDSGMYSVLVTYKEFEVYRTSHRYFLVNVDTSDDCSSSPTHLTSPSHGGSTTTGEDHMTTMSALVG